MPKIYGIIIILCAAWVIYDVATRQKLMSTGNKAIWVVCALFFSVITAIVYYVVVKQKN